MFSICFKLIELDFAKFVMAQNEFRSNILRRLNGICADKVQFVRGITRNLKTLFDRSLKSNLCCFCDGGIVLHMNCQYVGYLKYLSRQIILYDFL